MYSQNVIHALNDIAGRYAPLIKQSMTSVLTKYRNTGAGVSSVVVKINNGNESSAPTIEIMFDDHLIYLNHRRIEWTRLPDMKKLIAWAETKRSNPKEAQRLAFAVAWNQKKFDKWKAKVWRKASLSGVLKEMNQLILDEYDKAIEADLQISIEGGNT